MTRVFILVSDGLTHSRKLDSIDEAVSELESASKEDHKLRTLVRYYKMREELMSCESGTVFELEHHHQTGAPVAILTVLDID